MDNGTMKSSVGKSSLEDLYDTVTSSWTAEKSIIGVSAIIVIGLFSIYRIRIRPVLPVQVKCWFCHETNILPPENRNRFDCRHCDQYNGFSDDGDYNKDIPAQRDASINVFSAEAWRSGAKLYMYHNGLCDLCNTRQERKIEARNQFVPSDPAREYQEFEAYNRHLERNFPLCPTCERHVKTRIAYQDAYLDPLIRRWVSSQWCNRIGRFLFSEYMVLLASFLPIGSFYLPDWLQILPLSVLLILMLIGAAKNRFLFLSVVLRATTSLMDLSAISVDVKHRNLLNICSGLCAFVAAFGALQTSVGKLFGNKKRSSSPFTNAADLTRVLSPLLSKAFLKLKQTQNWLHKKQSSQLDSSLSALSLGKPSPKAFSSAASTQPSIGVPKSYVFGKSSHSSSGILKRSKLDQSFEEFTPPPSQENSSSGDYFVSASRRCCSAGIPIRQFNDDPYWDARTTATQPTVHTVVHAPRSSQGAMWTVAILLAALLLKLCWADLIYATSAVYVYLGHVEL